MKGIIYKYTFSDGKVYIGQTRRHPEKRRREHLNTIVGPSNSGFWDAYKKYGEPKYEELFEVELDDVDELVQILNVMETRFIQLFNADRPEFGYNKKSYGTVGTGTNAIIRKKFAELFKELSKQRLKVFNSAVEKIWHTKEPLTKEEKYLIKEKYRKENLHQDGIDSYDLDNLSSNFDEETEIKMELALDFVHIMINEEIENEASQIIGENYLQILETEKNNKTIVQMNKDGNVVREFYSFNEICQAFNVPRADNVINVLKGRQKSAYGFYWKYKTDL